MNSTYFAVSFFLVHPSSNPLSDSTTRHWLTDPPISSILENVKIHPAAKYCIVWNSTSAFQFLFLRWAGDRDFVPFLWKTLCKRYVLSYSYSRRLLVALFVFFANDSSIFEPHFLCFARKTSHCEMLIFCIRWEGQSKVKIYINGDSENCINLFVKRLVIQLSDPI